MAPPARALFSRQRLILGTLLGGGALFVSMKWKAVMQRSEAAKIAGSPRNFAVAAGRSGGGI
ncbi:hypothetical protein OCU04_010492 [Sclerotinia nivalis]|uniref:Uncharacterized protein n=1 Tax=Sclerotinia nivalis TaxID=352851 RepID=A0A9X0ADE2_9HELO|nr:hypothetical protein OCU04_010492 [Sclerotinia nivalis]